MIKQILKQLMHGNLSLPELASTLNLTRDELNNRLKMMGYIEVVCETPANGQKTCSFCPLSKECSEVDKNDSSIIIYKLTVKGKRMSRKKNGWDLYDHGKN